MRVIRITNWQEYFETSESRKYKSLRFVAIPNKLDGDGYTQLVSHPNGPQHYAVWVVMVLIASKCSPRGTLLRGNGQPYDAGSLARVSRLPESCFEEAIRRLSSDIGWIEFVDLEQIEQENLPERRENLPADQKELKKNPPNITEHEPTKQRNVVEGSASENLDAEESANAVQRILLAVMDDDLRNDADVIAIAECLSKANPAKYKPGDGLRARMLQVAEMCLRIGDIPSRLFNSTVKKRIWTGMSDEDRKRGTARFEAWKKTTEPTKES